MYRLYVDVKREVVERFAVEVQANDPEEAMDLVYEHFSTYPENQLVLDRRIKEREQTNLVEVLNVEHQREGILQDDLRESVFGQDD